MPLYQIPDLSGSLEELGELMLTRDIRRKVLSRLSE